jgi:hypothetical protein
MPNLFSKNDPISAVNVSIDDNLGDISAKTLLGGDKGKVGRLNTSISET